ncbi:MAG: LPS export ABC transporter periplasmic protein LptC [Gemmatimonadales bacterium]|jgi:LPS export ABC transporter protein LptC
MTKASGRAWLMMALGTALAACGESGEPPLVAEEVLQLNQEANQVVFGLTHWVTSEGVRRAQVEADTAFFIEDEATVELRKMRVLFFDVAGDTTSILTAREGEYDWNTQNMVAERDVVVVNPKDGRRVETSVLHYNRTEDRIWGDQPTKIFEPDGMITEGTAFETDSRMDRVQITSPRMVRPGTQPQRERQDEV